MLYRPNHDQYIYLMRMKNQSTTKRQVVPPQSFAMESENREKRDCVLYTHTLGQL
jgi:hypothetical protein